MTERVTHRSVEFRNSFCLPGLEGQQPAGIYEVVTIEEQIESLSFLAYRRLSTTIVHGGTVSGKRAEQVSDIDPEDLQDALFMDGEVANG